MLYCDRAIDFAREVLVFVHIPKTGGTSLNQMFREHWGDGAILHVRDQRLEEITWNRLHKLHHSLRRTLQYYKTNADQTVRRYFINDKYIATTSEKRLISGHFRLGSEKTDGRAPVYVTLVRDPVDRLLSEYYYYVDKVNRPGKKTIGDPKKWAAANGDFDYYVDFLTDFEGTFHNAQCFQISGERTFEAARKLVDNTLYLAATTSQIGPFMQLISEKLSFSASPVPRMNVSKSRPKDAWVSPKTREKILSLYEEDKKLCDYVEAEFDKLRDEIGLSSMHPKDMPLWTEA